MDTKLVAKLAQTHNEIEKIDQQIINATVALQERKAKLLETDQKVRDAIKEAMEKTGTKAFENDYVKITYVAATVRKGIDTAQLKADAPGIYDKYLKETPVKASVRIKVLDK